MTKQSVISVTTHSRQLCCKIVDLWAMGQLEIHIHDDGHMCVGSWSERGVPALMPFSALAGNLP